MGGGSATTLVVVAGAATDQAEAPDLPVEASAGLGSWTMVMRASVRSGVSGSTLHPPRATEVWSL